jgi:protoheme IX farnesyltransferase
MERTKKRALVRGTISVRNAFMLAAASLVGGSVLLILFVNFLTLLVGLTGFFFYVVLYTYIKKHSFYGTLVGTVSGATPPVAGYTAVTNNFDTAALLLFIILVVWQMPHFYSIAIFRLKDYKAAKIPVLPIIRGIKFTKITMIGYIFLFILSTAVLAIAGFAGLTFLLILTLAGSYWLAVGLLGFRSNTNQTLWAKKMFRTSLLVLLAFCLIISLEVVLP